MMEKEASPFLIIENATVKQLGKVVFQQLDFKMLEGQSWAILENRINRYLIRKDYFYRRKNQTAFR
jgi:hypothetical protein